MKKVLKIIVIALVVAFAAAQFYRPNLVNLPVNAAETLAATTQVPDDTQAILKRSCSDCHSNETVYPWYAKVTPANWLLANHIDEGRRELNFSVWATYDAKKRKRKLAEICEQVETGEMPHNQYLWIHSDAKLSAADVKNLCDWTDAERTRIGE